MKLEQSFEIKAPLEEVWAALIDVERVAPCLPGAEVTGKGEDGSYQGTFQVKLGPTTAAYRGTLKMIELDEGGHTVTMSANAQEKRGGGTAKARMISKLSDAGGATRVEVDTDFTLTGRLARFGRGGMIQDVSNRLLRDFSECLQRTLATPGAVSGSGVHVATASGVEVATASGPEAGGAGTAGGPGSAQAGPNGGRSATAEPADLAGLDSSTVAVAAEELRGIRLELAALRHEIEALRRSGAGAPAPQAKPINAFGVLLSVLLRRVKRLLGRSG